MFSNMPICKVEGFGINLGHIKLFPIAGLELPMQHNGIKTQVMLTNGVGMDGEINGVFAEIIAPDTVGLNVFHGIIRLEPPIGILVGRQINRDYLTRGHLRWVKEVRSRIGWSVTEAAQLPGSTL